jgi:hypothetical protein
MKRTTAALLWFYTGWTAGAFAEYIAAQNGVTIGPAFGLVLGAAAASLFAGDPRRLIWTRSTTASATSGTAVVAHPA